MKTLIYISFLAIVLSACSESVQNSASHVFDNAGGIVRGSRDEVANNWQTAEPGEKAGVDRTDAENQKKKAVR